MKAKYIYNDGQEINAKFDAKSGFFVLETVPSEIHGDEYLYIESEDREMPICKNCREHVLIMNDAEEFVCSGKCDA